MIICMYWELKCVIMLNEFFFEIFICNIIINDFILGKWLFFDNLNLVIFVKLFV